MPNPDRSTKPAVTNPAAVQLPGDLLSTNAEDIRNQITNALAKCPAENLGVFDLGLTYAGMVDSVGLNVIIWLVKQVRARGGSLRITVANLNVRRALEFTRVDRVAEIIGIGAAARS